MQTELDQRCQELIPQVLLKRDWQLVENKAAFALEVLAETHARLPNNRRTSDQIIEDATINRYNYVWYSACGEINTARQRRALEELHRYLFRVALYIAYKDRSIAEECAQEALITAWQHLTQVRDAGAFMRWASMIVIRLVKRKMVATVGEVEVADEVTDGNADRTAIIPADNQPQLTEAVRLKLTQAMQKCLSSDQQIAVIVGLFLNARTFKELADQLNVSVANISVLKSRALDNLRTCSDFVDELEALL